MRRLRHLVLAVALLASASTGTLARDIEPLASPRDVPPFVYHDQDDVTHGLSELRGHFVLLNIWATWCGPCVREMPSLDKVATQSFSKPLVVLPIAQDRDPARIGVFYQRNAITHLPVASDKAGNAGDALHLRGLPTTLILNPQGQEIARVEGSIDWSAPDTLAALERLLR